jgi:hypothetical protein
MFRVFGARRAVHRLSLAQLGLLAFAALASVSCAAPRQPARAPAPPRPHLECTYSASGDTRTIVVTPTSDPYGVAPVEAGERFALKVVYVTEPADVAGVRIYAYEVEAGGPVLLHEGKYPLPVAGGSAPGRVEFTGREFVYEHELGRELAYSCAWITP